MFLNNPKEISVDLISDSHLASWKYKKLVEQIKEFEGGLDQEHEIAIRLASFGTSILMAVENISYQNPDMLYFYGKVSCPIFYAPTTQTP